MPGRGGVALPHGRTVDSAAPSQNDFLAIFVNSMLHLSRQIAALASR